MDKDTKSFRDFIEQIAYNLGQGLQPSNLREQYGPLLGIQKTPYSQLSGGQQLAGAPAQGIKDIASTLNQALQVIPLSGKWYGQNLLSPIGAGMSKGITGKPLTPSPVKTPTIEIAPEKTKTEPSLSRSEDELWEVPDLTPKPKVNMEREPLPPTEENAFKFFAKMDAEFAKGQPEWIPQRRAQAGSQAIQAGVSPLLVNQWMAQGSAGMLPLYKARTEQQRVTQAGRGQVAKPADNAKTLLAFLKTRPDTLEELGYVSIPDPYKGTGTSYTKFIKLGPFAHLAVKSSSLGFSHREEGEEPEIISVQQDPRLMGLINLIRGQQGLSIPTLTTGGVQSPQQPFVGEEMAALDKLLGETYKK